ncbi:MAG: CBS domain-containing protein [Dysgonamonadaceae bacterium]|jgi:CBS domain containing-hemolysin-like protein|nr:CBS domain-containing protein [Dysgonamonadaceae bacterium]
MSISTNKSRTDLRKATQSLGNIFALSITGWLVVEISEPCLLRHVSGDIRIFSVQLLIALLSASIVGIFFPMLIDRIRARSERSAGKSMGKTDLDHFIQQTIERSPDHAELETEVKIFQNVLDFSNIRLKDCMVPRTEIVAFDLKTSKEELLAKFIETGLSKILIYNENIDDIVGYIHSTEMFSPSAYWKDNIKKIPIVPETMAANKLMKVLMQDKKTIAVVVDEFGGTVGLVTLEDLVEEIFGDIEDEHDMHSYVAKKKSETEFILSGRMEIDKVNEMFGLTLPESTDYQTVAGLILREYQRFPNFNDTIVSGRFSFTILRKTATKIELVKLKIAE